MSDLESLRIDAEKSKNRAARQDYRRALEEKGLLSSGLALLSDRARYRDAAPELQDAVALAIERSSGEQLEWDESTEFSNPAGSSFRAALFRHKETKIDLSLIPGDTELAPFLIGRFVVTNRQFYWKRRQLGEDKHLPKIKIPWEGIRHYLARYSFRTATPAEWRCVLQADAKTRFSFGDMISPSYVHLADNAGARRTAADHLLAANAFGLIDVVGNVWEMLDRSTIAGLSFTTRLNAEQPFGVELAEIPPQAELDSSLILRGVPERIYGAEDVGFRVVLGIDPLFGSSLMRPEA